MKKVIAHYFCDKNNGIENLKEFHIVENIETGVLSIKTTIITPNTVEVSEYSIAEFEYVWKINISELL
jgi:hypothetical protein